MEPLVDTAWLAANLANVVIFDATYYLPGEGLNAETEYQKAHIPGARLFSVDEVADPDTSLPHMVPSAGRFAKLMGAHGVSNASTVVFYDQKGLFSAARGWWLFGLFGHDAVAVLDGGLPKWSNEGRPLIAGPQPEVAPVSFTPHFRATWLRGLGDMQQNLQTQAEIVLDARAAARFAGRVAEPRPGLASGHIPGAKNLPFGDVLTLAQTMLSPEQLRTKFAALGVGPNSRVVTSCGSGVTATVLSLALARAGLPVGAVYDGSWTEWGLDPSTPKETHSP
jgi:thiosulfate/3-mercaptopyruvate sulfurtransferase